MSRRMILVSGFLLVSNSPLIAAGVDEITGHGVVRINGTRHDHYKTTKGEVYIPSTGLPFAQRAATPICAKHLDSKKDDVIKIREGIAMDDETKTNADLIVSTADKCTRGFITRSSSGAAPTDSGVELEIKAAPHDPTKTNPGDKAKGEVGIKKKL